MARTREEQRAEVAAWRASGVSMRRFAAARGYSRSSLEKWARTWRTALALDGQDESGPRFVRLEVVGRQATSELVVEVGAARIRVGHGFDAALLREIVSALGASS